MEPVNVQSSNIRTLSYDYAAHRLHVWFNAAPNVEYVYDGVPSSVFLAVLNAPSIGGAFSREVRSRPETYPYEKIIYLEY